MIDVLLHKLEDKTAIKEEQSCHSLSRLPSPLEQYLPSLSFEMLNHFISVIVLAVAVAASPSVKVPVFNSTCIRVR